MELPNEFRQRMQLQLGAEADAFFAALSEDPPTSIRLNHLKGKTSFINLEKIPWCEGGYYLETRPFFHLDPHWHGGGYYVQEASSMILDDVIRQIKTDNAPRIWLDMCAAPGGKTGILAKHIGPGDILVANEVVPTRKSILRENLYKGGYLHTMITGEQASSFHEPFADIILVDAPCAGEGMMRKEEEAINQWSPGLVRECSLLQHRILHEVSRALKPGGYLIYSTCSYSPAENIENVSALVKSSSFSSIPLNFPAEWNISTIEKNGVAGYQLYPHKVKGEGLFIGVLQKDPSVEPFKPKYRKQTNEFIAVDDRLKHHVNKHDELKIRKNTLQQSFIPVEAEANAAEVLIRFPKAEVVAEAGQFKGKDFIPSHFLAMSDFHSAAEKIELPLDQSLDYLERNTKTLPTDKSAGWYVVSFKGTKLGWAKNTAQGWKNHYPLNWRLRSRRMV